MAASTLETQTTSAIGITIDVNEETRILIIQTAFAGDLILTTPLVEAASRYFSLASIDVVCIPTTADLLRNNPSIHEIIVYDKQADRFGFEIFFRMQKRLRAGKYDVVLSPHRSFRSALIAWSTRAKKRVCFHTSSGRFLFTDVAPYQEQLHEVERVLSLLEIFGNVDVQEKNPRIYPGDEERKSVARVLSGIEDRFLVTIAPGSVWATKRWTEEGFRRVALALIETGFHIAFIGGKDDREIGARITQTLPKQSFTNFIGQLSLLESSEVIRRSRVLIANDSAPVHLASAMRTPVVDIFGPTIPEFGFAPYGIPHRIIRNEHLSCSPCSIHGGNVCPIKTFVCMRELSWETVFHAAITLIGNR